jgi:hypothetical protein
MWIYSKEMLTKHLFYYIINLSNERSRKDYDKKWILLNVT